MIPQLPMSAQLMARHSVDKILSTLPNSAAGITPRISIPSSKRAYQGQTLTEIGDDYAISHHVTLADLKRWNWKLAVYQGRPAFKFKTDTGYRYRFLDKEGGYKSEYGYKSCWYGLTPELIASIDKEHPLIICNGEISTIAAQKNLLLAICITNGEKGRIPDTQLNELKKKIAPGTTIIVARDCDPTGFKSAIGIVQQLREAGYDASAVDLGLSEGGDLADFCGVYGTATYKHLMECPFLDIPEGPAFTPRVMPSVRTSKLSNLSPAENARRRTNFDSRWHGAISALERTTSGRYMAAFTTTCLLANLVHTYGYRSNSDVRAAVEQACETNGYRADHGPRAVKAQIDGALRQPRQTLDMPDFQDKPRPAPQKVPQKSTAKTEIALPDALIKYGLDVFGLPVVSEFNYLFGAVARGLLPVVFTLEYVEAARAADGIESSAPAHVYTDMAEYGLLRKVSSELIDKMPPIDIDRIRGKTSINSKRGRKYTAYTLVSLDEYKKAMFVPLARSLVSMHPDSGLVIDEGLRALVQAVLEALLKWNKPYQSVHVGIVRGLLKDAHKHRAAEVYEALKALPIADAELLADMGLNSLEAEAVSSIILAQADSALIGLIALKNRLMARLYQTHIEALDNPQITSLPEGAPRVGEAWLRAYYNARVKSYNGHYLWAYELNALMGIDDKRSAGRAAQRSGITSEGRYETRPFTVLLMEGTPSWEAVRRCAKEVAKHEDSSLDGRIQRGGLIRSYDETGRLVGQAEYSEIDHPQGFDIGVCFTVELQLRNLITVADPAPSVDEAMPDSESVPVDEPSDPIEAPAQSTSEPKQARITPKRLHDRKWLLERLLAHVCKLEKPIEGFQWVNRKTGALYRTAEELLSEAVALNEAQLEAV